MRKLRKLIQNVCTCAQISRGDRFQGVTVYSNIEQCDPATFQTKLQDSLNVWKENNKRTIWFKIYLEQSEWIPVLAKERFKFHHAKEDYVMMYLWLPTGETCNIPAYAHTLVGVGGIVVNDESEVLVVREKYATKVFWKLPGGYVEPGEELVDAAIREIKEETGITTEFQSVIALRHTHQRVFDCSDIYMVVSLKPLTSKVTKSDQEIADCVWMKINDYLNHPEIHSLNKLLLRKYLEYKEMKVSIECMNGIHQILKTPYTFFSVNQISS